MTTKSINDQVRTIRTATRKASSSKEAAIAFLSKAGIISGPKKATGSALPKSTVAYAKTTNKSHSASKKTTGK